LDLRLRRRGGGGGGDDAPQRRAPEECRHGGGFASNRWKPRGEPRGRGMEVLGFRGFAGLGVFGCAPPRPLLSPVSASPGSHSGCREERPAGRRSPYTPMDLPWTRKYVEPACQSYRITDDLVCGCGPPSTGFPYVVDCKWVHVNCRGSGPSYHQMGSRRSFSWPIS